MESGRMGRPLGILILLAASAFAGDLDSLYTNVYCLACPLPTNFPVRSAPQQSKIENPKSKICLDPGHIGGEWARMEERWFQRGKDRPVTEAELNLTVAKLLQDRLTNAGIAVSLTKTNYQPVTDQRPEHFRAQAEQDIPASDDVAVRADAVRRRSELLFYRSAEIAARAKLINESFRPDLTLCIHFNAVEWDECRSLVADNRLLFFVHGNYLPNEANDPRLLEKLLEGSHATELAVAESIAAEFARVTGLPPAKYPAPVGKTGYVFARNLAANRLINGPVVYLEPYYMNNKLVYQRLQLGDYDGEKIIEGKPYRSIFREYADAVFAGLQPFLK